jgi:hypothetical protein
MAATQLWPVFILPCAGQAVPCEDASNHPHRIMMIHDPDLHLPATDATIFPKYSPSGEFLKTADGFITLEPSANDGLRTSTQSHGFWQSDLTEEEIIHPTGLAAIRASTTTYQSKTRPDDGPPANSVDTTINAATSCGTFSLPFSENFSGTSLPNCWSTQVSGTGVTDTWTLSSTNLAGGTANEMKSGWQSVNPGITRLISPAINTLCTAQLNLSFKHFLDAFTAGCTFRIQSSADKISWTNEAWSMAPSSANIGPATVATAILSNMNSSATYIAFEVDGNLYDYDYWYIDDVTLTGVASTLSVSPGSQAIGAAAGSTSFNAMSNTNWSVTSNQPWCTVIPSGTGNGIITVACSQNTTSTSRTATITATVNGCVPVPVTVIQAAPTLSVTPSGRSVTQAAGSATFSIASNSSWSCSSDQSWCTVTSSGTGNAVITATYSANTGFYPRVANITISVPGIPSQVVTVSQAETPGKPVALSLFLEGFYAGSGLMNPAMDGTSYRWGATITDMLTIELHDGSDYQNIVYSEQNVSLGTSGAANFIIPLNYTGNYDITIVSRNHIRTTTALPVSFSGASVSYSFDSPGKAFGRNLNLMTDGRYVLFAGDSDQDGIVDSSDLSDIVNLAHGASAGFLDEDLNGDGLVDSTDLSVAGNNAKIAVTVLTP